MKYKNQNSKTGREVFAGFWISFRGESFFHSLERRNFERKDKKDLLCELQGGAPCSLELAGVCSLWHRQSRSSGVLRAERSYFRRSPHRLVKVLHPPNSHSKQVRVLGQFYLPISLFMLEIVALMTWFGKKSQRRLYVDFNNQPYDKLPESAHTASYINSSILEEFWPAHPLKPLPLGSRENLWSPVPIASMPSYGQFYLYFQKPLGLTYGFQHLLISREESGFTLKDQISLSLDLTVIEMDSLVS
ncbi:hypothetical protein VNO77_41921 [Canavalia gladiata]|uniref:Uncharacterized protein n=1 Tax=Canavalia gladiata TaxID=3824 RepID=A0AAN9K367_CANGL